LTATSHNIGPTGSTGFTVVGGVVTNPQINVNAAWTATVIDTNTLDLVGSNFPAGTTYISGGMVSTQANAAQLSATWTRVTFGATGAGVRLPTGTAGNPPNKVKNATGNDGLVVWGVTGASINANPVNRPITIPSDWTGELWASSATQWDTQP